VGLVWLPYTHLHVWGSWKRAYVGTAIGYTTTKGSPTVKKLPKNFDFPEKGNRGAYDWDSILVPQGVILESGKDYTCDDQTICMQIRHRAAERGQDVQLKLVEGGVATRTTSEPDEERAAEYKSKRRAQQKVWQANAKAKRAAGEAPSEGEEGEEGEDE
jgi:hypothetical protein